MKRLLRVLSLLVPCLFFNAEITAQCNPGWSQYQTFTVNNTMATPLFNFQVKLTVNTAALIGGGNMQPNGADIRFTNTNCGNLQYYIESGINTASTSIWVKVDTIPGSGSRVINMYYGNPGANAVSNPDSVFEFQDDFDDNSFNTQKWETRGTFSVLNESGGMITAAGNSNWEYFRSRVNFTGPVVIEDRLQAPTSGGFVLGLTGVDNRFTFRETGGMCGTTEDPDVSSSNSWYLSGYPAVPFPLNNFNNFRVIAQITANTIQVQSYCNLTTSNCNTTPTSLSLYSGSQFYIGYSSWSGNLMVDWVRVRKYASSEPTVVVGNTQPNFLLNVVSLNDSTLCEGAVFTLNFQVAGSFNPGNTFTGQLSDAAGSFAAPSNVGSTAGNTAGNYSMNCTLPPGAAPGTLYLLRLKSSNPSVTGPNSTFNLIIVAPPAVNLGSDVIQCGNSATLDAGLVNMNYLWNTGGTGQLETVSGSGTYSVLVTDANGCSGNDSIQVTLNPDPVVNLGPDFSACAGGLMLDAGNAGATYLWNTGETTQTIQPANAGSYSVLVTDINGCRGRDTATLGVYPNPQPQITINGNLMDAGTGFASYAWFLNASAVSGGNTQTLTGSSTGWYRVDVTDSNGCSGTDSVYFYIFTSTDPGTGNPLSAWPNPFTNEIHIGGLQSEAVVTLFDMTGKMTGRWNLKPGQTLQTEALPAGVYQLTVEEGQVTRHVRMRKN